MEKLFDQTLDLRVGVLEKESNIAHIALYFDHIIQGEVGDDCQGGLSDPGVSFMEVLIQRPIVGFYDVREPMQEVPHGDDDVVLDYWVDVVAVEQFDDMGKLLFAEGRAEA